MFAFCVVAFCDNFFFTYFRGDHELYKDIKDIKVNLIELNEVQYQRVLRKVVDINYLYSRPVYSYCIVYRYTVFVSSNSIVQ